MRPRTNIPKQGELLGGQFLLGRTLGRGAFGIVFAAKQLGLDRDVAIKMLHPRSVLNDTVVERFKREAKLASSLTNPHAVVIHSVGVHQGKHLKLPYIVMEYLDGADLQEYTARAGRLSLPEASAVAVQALDCLSEAHRKGIIHRDLKPENLFLCHTEAGAAHIKVVDFGIAKAVSGEWGESVEVSLTRTGMVCGTPQFMPPEQAMGKKGLTAAVDVYAMGCIIFEMLAGEPPFTGNSPMDVAIKHVKDPIPPLPVRYRDSFLTPIIHRAMEKEASDRYANAAEMAAAIRAAAERADVIPKLMMDVVPTRIVEPATGDTGVVDVDNVLAAADPGLGGYSVPVVDDGFPSDLRGASPLMDVGQTADRPHLEAPSGGVSRSLVLAVGGMAIAVVLAFGALVVALVLDDPEVAAPTEPDAMTVGLGNKADADKPLEPPPETQPKPTEGVKAVVAKPKPKPEKPRVPARKPAGAAKTTPKATAGGSAKPARRTEVKRRPKPKPRVKKTGDTKGASIPIWE